MSQQYHVPKTDGQSSLVSGQLDFQHAQLSNGAAESQGDWLADDHSDIDAKNKACIRAARSAVDSILSQHLRRQSSSAVSIHSGPSADKPSKTVSSVMPSISESPLEQDFTVPGTPSKLGCPFASMENRRLSKHAASVVSRYKQNGTMTPHSSVSIVNGTSGSAIQQTLQESTAGPEQCAMVSPTKVPADIEGSVQGSTGVCPIRFLSKDTPEAVAAYFEEHKHEIPRSHELCVKRYQSNEESIRQLDAKYGNLVSMISGLGQKHASLLPEKALETADDMEDRESAEKVQRWAQNVVVSTAAEAADAAVNAGVNTEDEEERLPHFDRPMRDVRLGESPSRPWGIQVPISIHRKNSDASSTAAQAAVAEAGPCHGLPSPSQPAEAASEKPRGRCPFGFDGLQKLPGHDEAPIPVSHVSVATPVGHGGEMAQPVEASVLEPPTLQPQAQPQTQPHPQPQPQSQPVFLSPEDATGLNLKTNNESLSTPRMVFTGPVFIGYTTDQALALLQGMKR